MLVIIAVGSIFILEKTNVINLFGRDTPEQSYASSGSNDQENQDTYQQSSVNGGGQTISSEKQLNNTSDNNESQQAINVIITYVNQGSDKYINVGTLIEGISLEAGICKLQFIQNEILSYTIEAPIIRQSSLFTCEGFRVSPDNIPNSGDWDIRVTVSNKSQNDVSNIQSINIDK